MILGDFAAWNMQNILIRVIVAAVLGCVIGLDRGMKHRGAGTKTITVVCLGATLVMLTEQYIQIHFPGLANMNRLSAQVISGVGFLGAGSILISGHQIKGLTSAASIWTCACIGLAVGIGLIDGAVVLTVCWLIGVHMIPYIEEKLYRHSRFMTLYLETEDGKAITAVSRKIKGDHCFIDTFDVDKPKAKGQPYQITTTFRIPKGVNKEAYMRALQELKGVNSVNEI